MATFKFINTFSLHGRGLVIYGDIKDGSISIGDTLVLDKDFELPIHSVEFLDYRNPAGIMKARTAFVIKTDDAKELQKKVSKYKKQKLTVKAHESSI